MQMQMIQQLNVSAGSSYSSCKAEGVPDHFPAGMRVLLVDDDSTCLKILEQMLKKCMYSVTTCNRATHALSLLREKRCGFDMVISDVHMPDMDGFKLLEIVGLEMDLPVIMMSADGRTTTVLKGVKHGACDFLTKPVRMEELKNIWQHVVRKKWNESKDLDQSGSLEDNDKHKRTGDDAEYASSVNEGSEANWKGLKKRKESKDDEDDGEQENEDPSASKKPRVVWSVELHQQFVNAVHQLGIEKAVPKRILELMNVPGLTRENVASHLQKFRLYLKRLSGVTHSQSGICGSYGGPIEPNTKVGPLSSINIQGFAATGQIPPQTFAALHAEILSRHGGGSLVVPSVDQPALLQAAFNGQKGTQLERSPTFVQPFLKAQPNLPKQFVQSNIPMEDLSSGGFVSWPQPLGTASTTNNMGGFASQNGNAVMQLHQHQQQPLQLESGNLLNVQPSCIVTPTNSSNLTSRSNVVSSSTTQNLSSQSFGGSSLLDYNLFQSVNNVSIGPGQGRDTNLKNAGLLSGYPLPGSISPSVSCSVMPQGNNSPHDWRMPSQMTHISPANQLSGLGQNTCEVSYADKSGDLLNQGLNHSHNILYKGPGIQNRYPGDNLSRGPFASELNQGPLYITDDVDIVKQEMNPDFMDNMKVALPVFQSYSPNDLMTIYSK